MEVIEYNHMYRCHTLHIVSVTCQIQTPYTILRQDIGINIRKLK